MYKCVTPWTPPTLQSSVERVWCGERWLSYQSQAEGSEQGSVLCSRVLRQLRYPFPRLRPAYSLGCFED